jgi:hypothetical protein
MSKSAWLTVAVLAVLLTGIATVGEGCGPVPSSSHSCCAEVGSEPVSSCCPGSETDATSDHAGQDLDCTCVHPPVAAFAVTLASQSGQDGAPTSNVADGSRSEEPPAPDARRTVERRFRTHPPPLFFLLDCAFLI